MWNIVCIECVVRRDRDRVWFLGNDMRYCSCASRLYLVENSVTLENHAHCGDQGHCHDSAISFVRILINP
jgi:hypothetical protein